MVGVPMVLRDDENFRRIGELFGKTVDDGLFTWGNIDISAGYCLVLTEIGNKIEEVINLAWKNRVYPVWVSEMGDNWVPEFCVDQSAMEAVGTEDELEDGEFRLPRQSPAGAEALGREDETNKCMGTGRIFQEKYVSNEAAHADESMHVATEEFKSPGGPIFMDDQQLDEPNYTRPINDLGHTSAFNSKKRLKRFRSPDDVGFDLGPSHSGLVDEVNSSLPFPDLNSVIPETCPSAAIQSSENQGAKPASRYSEVSNRHTYLERLAVKKKRLQGFCEEAVRAYLSSTHEADPAYLPSTQEEDHAYLSSTHEAGAAYLSSTQEEDPAYLSSTHESGAAYYMSCPDVSAVGWGVTDWYQSLGYRELDMDSYAPSSPVYRPGTEPDWEEDFGTPVYRSPTPPTARPRFDVKADWIRNTGPRLRTPGSPAPRNPYQTPHPHNQLPLPLRDPYLMPDPYHPNPWVRHTTASTGVMGFPTNDIHQYVRTSEFERQRMEQGVIHDLQGQRMDSLPNQLGYQKELISILEKEMLENRTETARAEARSATRVTIAVLILVIIFFLVESYQRR
ncbi:hypothetical protein L1987_02249 [Smallanthus sonchifolius]|uniref:Uncharacterized protein n=1 Tax=Smallanthus sonchifolius TaxID=185202 RepID=A0ACB9K784_9ASTR|nr:hypothetical protein L1987_02249 [Smallanthus sonchifolius]